MLNRDFQHKFRRQNQSRLERHVSEIQEVLEKAIIPLLNIHGSGVFSRIETFGD